MVPYKVSGMASRGQSNRSSRRSRRRANQNGTNQPPHRTPSGNPLLRQATNSHIRIVPRVADSDEHGTHLGDDVPMFRNPSYQVEASAGRSPTLNQGPNTAQATFADMARSGLTPRTPDISSREQPTSPEALSDNPSVESGSGIVKLRPTSRVKVPKAWKTLELDYSTTFKPLHTNRAATPDGMSRLNDDNAPVTGNTSSEPVAEDYEGSLGAEKHFTPDGKSSDPADDVEQTSVLPDAGEEFDSNAAALQSHFESVRSLFGVHLPGPQFLDNRVGSSHAELVFFLHPNGDVAAHIWSLHAYQWINLGLFSYSRKKIEGPLAQERLRGQKIGCAVPPGTLEYFRACAEQRKTASSPRPSVFSFRPANPPPPPPPPPPAPHSRSPSLYARSVDSRAQRAYMDRLSMPPPSFIPAPKHLVHTDDTISGAIRHPTTQLPSVMPLPQLSSSSNEIASQSLQYDSLLTSFDRFQQTPSHQDVRNEPFHIGGTNDAYESSESESSALSPDLRHEMRLYIQEPVGPTRLTQTPTVMIPISRSSKGVQPRLLVAWGVNDSLAQGRSADGLEVLARPEALSTQRDPFGQSKSTYFGNLKLGETGPGADRGSAALALLGVPGGHRERGRTVLHDPFKAHSGSAMRIGHTDQPNQANLRRVFGTGFSNETPSEAEQALDSSSTLLGELPLHWTPPWFDDSDSDATYSDATACLTSQGPVEGRQGLIRSFHSTREHSAAVQVLLPVGQNLVSYTKYSPQNNIKMLCNWNAFPRRCIDDTPEGRSSFFANFFTKRQK